MIDEASRKMASVTVERGRAAGLRPSPQGWCWPTSSPTGPPTRTGARRTRQGRPASTAGWPRPAARGSSGRSSIGCRAPAGSAPRWAM